MVRCSPRAPRFQPRKYPLTFDKNLGSPQIYFFYLHTSIRQKYMVLFHLLFLLCTITRPKIRILGDLFLLFDHDYLTEIYGPLSFILSFVHNHSSNTQGPLRFVSFICARPFDKNIWSSFIYSFFYAQPFVQYLGSSQICFFYLRKTIRQKDMVIFHLFFLCARTFNQNLGS